MHHWKTDIIHKVSATEKIGPQLKAMNIHTEGSKIDFDMNSTIHKSESQLIRSTINVLPIRIHILHYLRHFI